MKMGGWGIMTSGIIHGFSFGGKGGVFDMGLYFL